jgi:NAD(P)H-hydrate epimerase
MTDVTLSSLLPLIPLDANKYTRGSLLVLAGSARFPGAAILAAQAAARTGAGYVTLGIPESAAPIAQSHLLSIPVIALPSNEGAFAANAWTEAQAQLKHIDAIVLGSGLTVTPSTSTFVVEVLQQAVPPLLLDADALNVLSALTNAAELSEDNNVPSHLVLTPHAGELARLLAATQTADAQQLSLKLNAIVVAKGPETHIFAPDRSYSSTAGTPALAKAGTGDVLSGIIGALLSQGVAPFDAAVLGVELHGRAGQLAEGHLGRRSVCAEDVIEFLPLVLKALDAERT